MFMIRDSMYIMAAASPFRHKHLRIDAGKLARAKRLLEAATETEAIDRALTLVVSEGQIDAMLRRYRGKGKLKKAFR
jgi:hypothetical protein